MQDIPSNVILFCKRRQYNLSFHHGVSSLMNRSRFIQCNDRLLCLLCRDSCSKHRLCHCFFTMVFFGPHGVRLLVRTILLLLVLHWSRPQRDIGLKANVVRKWKKCCYTSYLPPPALQQKRTSTKQLTTTHTGNSSSLYVLLPDCQPEKQYKIWSNSRPPTGRQRERA